MHNITIKDSPKVLPIKFVNLGQVFKVISEGSGFKNMIMMKCSNIYVNLETSNTWSHNYISDVMVEILPVGTRLEITLGK